MPSVPKRIYLTKRNPNLTRDQFRTRWRQHAALGMAQASWRAIGRYVQSDLITCTGGIGGASDAYDGMACIWYRSAEARQERVRTPGDRIAMLDDEDEIFAQRIDRCATVCDERVILAGSVAGVKRVVFLPPILGSDSAEQGRHRDELAERRLSHTPFSDLVTRYVLNVPISPETGTGWGLDCGCIEEIWYADLARMLAAERLLAELKLQGHARGAIAVLGVDVVLQDR